MKTNPKPKRLSPGSADCYTVEDYLEYVGCCRNSAFGKRYRDQFRDARGTAELAMLASPSEEEYRQFSRLVRVMTDEEKQHPERLGDADIQALAARANAEPANIGIFLNGYVLACRNRIDAAGIQE